MLIMGLIHQPRPVVTLSFSVCLEFIWICPGRLRANCEKVTRPPKCLKGAKLQRSSWWSESASSSRALSSLCNFLISFFASMREAAICSSSVLSAKFSAVTSDTALSKDEEYILAAPCCASLSSSAVFKSSSSFSSLSAFAVRVSTSSKLTAAASSLMILSTSSFTMASISPASASLSLAWRASIIAEASSMAFSLFCSSSSSLC
mmetsp:Transcript_12031/g.23181  ORF Transcript_12031/g.23181 Transcript_12031/m.23181 type:complete len:205 (+) Transcript_12031:967-1581(+)